MRSACRGAVILALSGAAPAAAQGILYMSDPGLCDAPDGVTELLDTVFLTARRMENHSFSCTWDEPLDDLLARHGSAELTARCENGQGRWTAELGFFPQDNSDLDFDLRHPVYLSVHQATGAITPTRFYACDPTAEAAPRPGTGGQNRSTGD